MDKNQKIEAVIDELFDKTITTDITVAARDEFIEKSALLNSLKD